MAFDPITAVPAVATILAALVAGGIARANLVASKENKVSEFRQAWVDELRKDLAALFSNVRTICRALQELRSDDEKKPADFKFPQSKIIEARHASAETYHRIKLRLNPNQPDHQQLREHLREMMQALQAYIVNEHGDGAVVILSVDDSASFAEGILKAEWETVKFGEKAYREAVQTTSRVLKWSLGLLAVLVIGIPLVAILTPAKETPPPIAVVKVEVPAAPAALGSPAASVAPKAEILQTNPPGSPSSVAVKADPAGHNK